MHCEKAGMEWVLSQKFGGQLLQKQGPLPELQNDEGPTARVWFDPAHGFQEIEGFGGAFTEAAAVTWQQLAPAQRQEVLRAYFSDPDDMGTPFAGYT